MKRLYITPKLEETYVDTNVCVLLASKDSNEPDENDPTGMPEEGKYKDYNDDDPFGEGW